MVLRFDDIEVDVDAFEIRRAGGRIHVEPQVFDVIRTLIDHRDRLVSKEELLDTVWGTRFVTESALTSRIKAARRALGDNGREQRVIQTVHGRGYRFVVPLDEHVPLRSAGLDPGDGEHARLLERDDALEALSAAVASAGLGRGRIVVVTGEPGIGKTALVRAFIRSLGDRARVLFGSCDDLVTPRPLGPFDDMASAAPALAAALASPTPADVHRALLGELRGGPHPVIVVIEDAHWADEATIDVLTWLVRRIETLPVTVVLTYRDGVVIDAHPLLPMLGSIPPAITQRLRLEPLSTAAVAELVGTDRAEQVASATGGIPFFVSEVAALDPLTDGDVPASVTHAVLARIARLPTATRDLLDQLAVEPSRTATSLLDRLQPDWADDVEPAEQLAVITSEPGWLAFRHELARRAVLEAMPASRRAVLHRAVASALAAADADPARVVHHAEAGGDVELLVTHARIAADRAAAASAHREAWSHLQRLVPLLDHIPAADVATLLEFASREAYAAGDMTAAHDLAARSLDEFRTASDTVGRGRLHRWLSRIRWFEGRRLESEVQARLAVDVLEPLGPSEELAWAFSNLSQLSMLAWHSDDAVRWGERAIEVATAVDAQSALAHAMLNVATARAMTTEDEGPHREAVAVALAAGEHHEVVRGLGLIAYRAMESDRLLRAAEVGREALAYAENHEVETLRQYLIAILGRVAFLEGRWEEAEELLGEIARSPMPVNRMFALRTLAQLQLRRGDPEAARTIAEGRRLADQAAEPQRTLPMVEIEAEQAWLDGRVVELVPRLVDAMGPAQWFPAFLGRIARWLQEAGSLDEVPADIPEPRLAELEGRWADAADAWRERGMPYEEALALARTGNDGLVEARAIAERLGAAPLLRRLGAPERVSGVAGRRS